MKDIPNPLLEMMNGFQASRILFTALELDLFSALSSTGSTSPAVAKKISADQRGVDILLHALAAVGLIRKKRTKFYNSPTTRNYFSKGGRYDCRLAMGHRANLWDAWSDLTGVVKRGTPRKRKRSSKKEIKDRNSFIALMHHLGASRAPHLARSVNLTSVNRVLDLGGGSGIYSTSLVRRKPKIEVVLLDLPQVIPITKAYVKKGGVTSNYTYLKGNLTKDSFGRGYDLVLASQICHMLSPAQNQALFKKACRALNQGGQLVVHDFLLSPNRIDPAFAALFAVNMLVNTKGGNNYTMPDYKTWMGLAGFSDISAQRMPGSTNLVIGRC